MSIRVLTLLAVLFGFWSHGWDGCAEEVGRPNSSSEPNSSRRDESGRRFESRSPRVVFITSQGCGECDRILTQLRRPGGDFETMTAAGWRIGSGPDNHIQIVDQSEVVDLVERLAVKSFPTVACISDGEIIRAFTDGCTTPLDSWTLSWLMKGKDERPTPVKPEPIKVATTGNYPLRGNHWSVDGIWNPSKELLVSHMRGPVHSTQLSSTWQIESWAYEELRSLHDDLHEREMGGAVPTSLGTQQSSQPTSSFSNARKLYGKF